MHQGVCSIRSILYSLNLFQRVAYGELGATAANTSGEGHWQLGVRLADGSPFATMCLFRKNHVLCAVVSNLLCFLLIGTRLVLQHFPLWLAVSLPLISLPEHPTPFHPNPKAPPREGQPHEEAASHFSLMHVSHALAGGARAAASSSQPHPGGIRQREDREE